MAPWQLAGSAGHLGVLSAVPLSHCIRAKNSSWTEKETEGPGAHHRGSEQGRGKQSGRLETKEAEREIGGRGGGSREANLAQRLAILLLYASDPGKRNDSGKLVNSNRTQSQFLLFFNFHKTQVTLNGFVFAVLPGI